jgi:hypothetical protein
MSCAVVASAGTLTPGVGLATATSDGEGVGDTGSGTVGVTSAEFRAIMGTVVDKDGTHRGIAYSIYRLSEQRWTWHVEPPACIKGLRHEKGEVSGEQTDAAAARNAIEIQIRQFTQ